MLLKNLHSLVSDEVSLEYGWYLCIIPLNIIYTIFFWFRNIFKYDIIGQQWWYILNHFLKANQYSRKMEIKRCLCSLFEYETPRFVTVRYLPLGILKIITQICVLVFVVVYEMYYAKGYQTFANVRSSVTTKVVSS